MNLIEALKNNEKAFGLMTDEMQAKILFVEYRHVENYSPGGSWDKLVMEVEGYDDHETWTFRLRPGYKEEPAIIECEVIKDSKGDLRYTYGTHNRLSLECASRHARFIGFKYEDGNTYAYARRYKSKSGCTLTVWRKDYEVLTPTHVLFRRSE